MQNSHKANNGVGGIDGIDFDEYEKNLKGNLYKLWNRMTSGSYFPKAVRGVEIPKKNGKNCRSARFDKHHENEKFVFLGYSFRSRLCKSKEGHYFMGFTPAVSKEAGKHFRDKIRNAIKIANTSSIETMAVSLNPIIRGWLNYFNKFTPSETFRQGINYVNLTLARWLKRTHKKVKNSIHKAQVLLQRISNVRPDMFSHWEMGYLPVT